MMFTTIATPFSDYRNGVLNPSPELIFEGTSEEEAVRIAKEASPYYREIVAKAAGGEVLYRQVNPEIRYDSYCVVGLDDGRLFPRAWIYKTRDRKEAIDEARRHIGEFDQVEVWAMGEYEEGFDSKGAIVSYPLHRDRATR